MADDILVTISAQIDQLVSGFNEASNATAEALSKLQDQVNTASDAIQNQLAPATEKAGEALNDISEKFETAFTVAKVIAAGEAVLHFGEQLDELALKSIHAGQAAAIIGIGVPELQGLQAAANEAGIGTDQLDRALEMLSLRMQQARDGSSGMQEKLAHVGITIKDLEDPTFTAASAAVQLAESHASAGEKLAVVGRRGIALLPVFQALEGGEAGAIAKAKELGATTAQEALQLRQYHVAITEISERWEYFKTTIAAAVVPAIGELFTQLAKMFGVISTDKSTLDGLASAARDVAVEFLKWATAAKDLGEDLEYIFTVFGSHFGAMAAEMTAVLHGELTRANSIAKDDLANLEGIRKEHEARIVANHAAMAAAIQKIDESQLTGVAVTARKVPTVPLDVKVKPSFDWAGVYEQLDEKLEKDMTKAMTEIAASADSTARKTADAQVGSIDRQIEAVHHLAAEGRISADQELASTTNLLNKKWAALEQYYATARALFAGDQKEQDKLNKQEEKDYDAHLKALQKAQEQASKQMDQMWKSLTTSLSNSMASAIEKMMAGTETFGQALRSIFTSVFDALIKKIAEWVAQWIAQQIAGMFAAKATNAAETLSNAGVAASGAMASVAAIPWVGWAMAPGVGAATFAEAASYASAAGGWEVPADTMAMVHKNEMILPSDISQGLKGIIAAGGAAGSKMSGANHTFNFTVPTMDAKSFKGFLEHPTMQKILTNTIRRAYSRGAR